jgi:hypothetical protein
MKKFLAIVAFAAIMSSCGDSTSTTDATTDSTTISTEATPDSATVVSVDTTTVPVTDSAVVADSTK